MKWYCYAFTLTEIKDELNQPAPHSAERLCENSLSIYLSATHAETLFTTELLADLSHQVLEGEKKVCLSNPFMNISRFRKSGDLSIHPYAG